MVVVHPKLRKHTTTELCDRLANLSRCDRLAIGNETEITPMQYFECKTVTTLKLLA